MTAKTTTPTASRGEARTNNDHDHNRRRGHIHVPSAAFVFRALIVLLCASAGFIIAPRAFAQVGVGGGIDHALPDDTQLQFVSSWGGAVNAVEVDETARLAYVGTGRRLVVVDVADERHPVELGAVDMGNLVLDLEIKDGYAFVVTQGIIPKPFHVVDISNSTRPRIVARERATQLWQPRKIKLYGTLAYIIREREPSFWVYNVSDPENPIYLGEQEFPPAPIRDFAIVGDLLYLIDEPGNVQLRVFDLSVNPLNPPLIDSIALSGSVGAASLAIDGDYAVAALDLTSTNQGALIVIDVSDQEDLLRWAGSTNTQVRRPTDVAFANGIAYISDPANTNRDCDFNMLDWDLAKGLAIFDIWQNPTSPPLIGTFKTHGATSGVEVFGNTAYTFDDGEGLVLVDMTLPFDPVRLGHYYSPAFLRMMDRAGDLLYVTDMWNGLTILDVSNLSAPELVGVYQTPVAGRGDHWGIDVVGHYAYLSAGWSGPRVVDVNDPSAPTLEAEVEDWPDGMKVLAMEFDQMGDRLILHVGRRIWDCSSQIAYLTNYEITNLGNGTRIQEVGSLPFGEPLTIRTTEDAFAHIAAEAHVVVDTGEPENPELVDYIFPPDAVDCDLAGNLLFMADERTDAGGGPYIFDVTDPFSPVQLWHYSVESCLSIGVSSERLAFTGVEDGTFRLFLFDITNPESPIRFDREFFPQRTVDLFLQRSQLFLTTKNNAGGLGVEIYSIGGPFRPAVMTGRGP